MESKFVNDVRGKYLLLSSDACVSPGFESKMFLFNEIPFFLSFDTQRINNKLSFAYALLDYKNMAECYNNQSFGAKDIKKIFMAITLAGQSVTDYLLNPDNIMLNPDYIYVKGEDFRFCYYPGEETGFHKGIRELMEYILERLDHSQQENVMMAYGLYQKILKNTYTMEQLMEEFCKEDSVPVKKEPIKKEIKEETETPKLKIERREEPVLSELEEELEEKKPGTEKKEGKFFWNWMNRKNKKKVREGSYPAGCGTTLLAAETNDGSGSTQLLGIKMLIHQGMGKDISLTDFPISIGSSAQAKVVLDNIMVSRMHAVITRESGFYYVEDEGSTNGTFVNGSKISPYEPIQIKEGDQITFANEKYCFN